MAGNFITEIEIKAPAGSGQERTPKELGDLGELGEFETQADSQPAYQQMYLLLDDFKEVCAERQQARADLLAARQESFWLLALSIGLQNGHSPANILQVGVYAALLADALGWSPEDCDELQQATLLRDIGMVSVSNQLAPMVRVFSESEQALLQTHPTIGARLLGDGFLPGFRLAAEVALSHHEQFDGKG
ncbi:MAG: HD domain-containing phosphohydrolase, partial [Betaproteobacteria bacterium]